MVAIDRSLTLPETQYFPQVHHKDLIVLHGTAGSSAKGAVEHWNTSADRVATAFIIARDGTVHEVFPRNCWAWHVGFNGVELERRSVGVELVNIGPLRRHGNEMRNAYGSVFCHADEQDRYVQRSWRGYDCYATYTAEQYMAVRSLLDELCAEFGISRDIRASGELVDHPREAKGIATHTNFRRDKWDIGPAFEWERIVA